MPGSWPAGCRASDRTETCSITDLSEGRGGVQVAHSGPPGSVWSPGALCRDPRGNPKSFQTRCPQAGSASGHRRPGWRRPCPEQTEAQGQSPREGGAVVTVPLPSVSHLRGAPLSLCLPCPRGSDFLVSGALALTLLRSPRRWQCHTGRAPLTWPHPLPAPGP